MKVVLHEEVLAEMLKSASYYGRPRVGLPPSEARWARVDQVAEADGRYGAGRKPGGRPGDRR